MNVSFVFRHLSDVERRADLEDCLDQLSQSLPRYFGPLRSAHWTAEEGAEGVAVACSVSAGLDCHHASSAHADARVAALRTFEKLVKQRRRTKKQRLGARRAAAPKRTALAEQSLATGEPHDGGHGSSG